MFSVVAMVIVMAMVVVVNKEATFQGDYQCCGDNDDGDDLDVFLRRHSDGDRHGNGDGDDDDGGDDNGGDQGGCFQRWSLLTSLAW